MAARDKFGNHLLLVLLPVCAYSNKVIKTKQIKAQVSTENGDPLSGVSLTVKGSGYLVFSCMHPIETDRVRVMLEVPGYLAGSCTFPVNNDRNSQNIKSETGKSETGKSDTEHRLLLYPTRSSFVGQNYTAIYGTASVGSRIFAYTTEGTNNVRLMADLSKGSSEISIYTGNETGEGRIFAAVLANGKQADIIETDEMIDYPYKYHLKSAAKADLKQFTDKLYPVQVTEPAPDGTYFLPLHTNSSSIVKYTVIKADDSERTSIETAVVSGKENRVDF